MGGGHLEVGSVGGGNRPAEGALYPGVESGKGSFQGSGERSPDVLGAQLGGAEGAFHHDFAFRLVLPALLNFRRQA